MAKYMCYDKNDICTDKQKCNHCIYKGDQGGQWLDDEAFAEFSSDASKRGKLCDEAKKIITHDRNTQYGAPENNFEIIASLWSDYLEHNISAHDVGIMMTLFKIGRIKSGGHKDDNYVDAIGYMACAGEIGAEDGEIH